MSSPHESRAGTLWYPLHIRGPTLQHVEANTLRDGQKGGDIHGFGDAIFFSIVQLLTVSSQIKNPLTVAGRIVDVGLEVWAVFVVTVVAGSFATFFSSGDKG